MDDDDVDPSFLSWMAEIAGDGAVAALPTPTRAPSPPPAAPGRRSSRVALVAEPESSPSLETPLPETLGKRERVKTAVYCPEKESERQSVLRNSSDAQYSRDATKEAMKDIRTAKSALGSLLEARETVVQMIRGGGEVYGEPFGYTDADVERLRAELRIEAAANAEQYAAQGLVEAARAEAAFAAGDDAPQKRKSVEPSTNDLIFLAPSASSVVRGHDLLPLFTGTSEGAFASIRRGGGWRVAVRTLWCGDVYICVGSSLYI